MIEGGRFPPEMFHHGLDHCLPFAMSLSMLGSLESTRHLLAAGRDQRTEGVGAVQDSCIMARCRITTAIVGIDDAENWARCE